MQKRNVYPSSSLRAFFVVNVIHLANTNCPCMQDLIAMEQHSLIHDCINNNLGKHYIPHLIVKAGKQPLHDTESLLNQGSCLAMSTNVSGLLVPLPVAVWGHEVHGLRA